MCENGVTGLAGRDDTEPPATLELELALEKGDGHALSGLSSGEALILGEFVTGLSMGECGGLLGEYGVVGDGTSSSSSKSRTGLVPGVLWPPLRVLRVEVER